MSPLYPQITLYIGVLLGIYRDNGKKMETTKVPGTLHIGVLLGLYRDNGKENGNYQSTLALYWGHKP